jgi:hypothetical protein
MVAEGHFRKETRSAIDGGGVPPHTQRAIPGPEPGRGSCMFLGPADTATRLPRTLFFT